ncbi:hypothetical protein AALO_G00069190 [Alosa alosa]|uniref:RILP-like protein 1 n=2 Tax=Alosa alosa TaxID=278164 RepID=A0AAV6H796_9TELE|nr:RILP-like protein 1 isoform X2 [Alosa alosa]KAG5281261.1 hypothetical protein AALO_G00069190 [Alosa alosa]
MDNCGKALEKNPADLTVMDVYDIAAVMGQEFERIIDQYGCESLTRIMPKVVRVLEILEVLVGRNNISAETEELRLELDRLRLERRDRLEREKRHQKELELVEDVWRGESQELLSQIAELQSQNKGLMSSLALRDNLSDQEKLQQDGMSEKEKQVVRKLKEVVDQQKCEIQNKDHELMLKSEDLEALQMQQHRLMRMNQELRQRVGLVEAQGKAMIQQRSQLEAEAHAQQQELGELRRELARLRDDRQEGAPLSAHTTPQTQRRRRAKRPSTVEKEKKRQQPPAEAAAGARSVEASLWVECGMDQDFLSQCCGPADSPAHPSVSHNTGSSSPSPTHNTSPGIEDEEVSDLLWEALQEEEQQESDVEQAGSGRSSVEQGESSPPRFTLQDLQEVLQERNELKSQVFMLQEELAYYKSEDQEEFLLPINPMPSTPPSPPSNEQQESGIKRLIFTAVMPMVAAGLISDDPTLLPIRRLISFV